MASASLAVAQREFNFEDSMFTFNLAAGIVIGDVGKAVSIDTGADMTVKLCGDGDKVIGRLEQVEDRGGEGLLVGTVAMRFVGKLPSSGAIARGIAVVGSATPGSVKAAAALDITFTLTEGTPNTLLAHSVTGDRVFNNVTLSAAAGNLVNVAFNV